MNRKKLTALIMVLALAFTTLVGGTLAYFTDEDDAVNTFTFGKVSIEQNEWQRNTEDGSSEAIVEFEQNKNTAPAVLNKLVKEDITVDGYSFKIRSQKGNYVDKIVNVTNTGNQPAYIRTIFAIPSMNGFDDTADASFNPLHWNYLDATDFNGTGWDWNGSNDAEATEQLEYVQNVEIGGVLYDIYVATYNEAVEAGAITSPSMVGFYLHDSVGFNNDEGEYFFVDKNGVTQSLAEWMKPDNNGLVTLNILVLSQAAQIDGFDDAWEALDTAFGVVDATNAKAWFEEILPQA